MVNKSSVVVMQENANRLAECAFALSGEFNVVGCFCDGEEGVMALTKLNPYFLIISPRLDKKDGFEVIAKAKTSLPNIKCIVIGEDDGEALITRAIQVGASYYVSRPVDYKKLIEYMKLLIIEPQPPEAAALSVKETPITNARASANENVGINEEEIEVIKKARRLDERISEIFLKIGIPPHIRGYFYLREAIKLAVKAPELINSVTKKLYPAVAEIFNTTSSKVERAIRHAIEVAWNKGRIDAFNALFGVRAYSESEKPTNSEFIALIADRLFLDGLS